MIKNVSNWFFGSFFRTLGRIVLYVLLGFLLSFILNKLDIKLPSLLYSNTYAKTYQLSNTGTSASFYPSGSNSNLKWTQLYYNGTANIILNGWTFNAEVILTDDPTASVIYDGRYLISYYVYGVGTFTDLKCNQITSTFYNYNRTTGNLITSEITNNKCIDIYRTTYNGYNAYRILFEFTYTNKTGAGGATDFRFVFNSGYNPIKGGSTGINYGFQVEGINDYDISILDSWNTQKQNQTIINQNTEINNNINNQTNVLGASIGAVGTQVAGIESQITDDSVNGASSQASSFFNNFSTNDHGLSGIITAPLTAISSITSATCSPVVIPLPFVNSNLTLPCMRPIYEQFFGDFITLYDIIITGIIAYWILVKIFALVKDFKNPEHDEVEVMEL